MTHVTYLNAWFRAVYMRYTSKNFCLFRVLTLFVLNLQILLIMYPGSVTELNGTGCGGRGRGTGTDGRE